ncbi:hypothetical protein [Ureaplasma urealyticum]|uniref:hypothetical protein n=1 Tax=Ureaplasma urealyticum TaxID=2130 RepID=UPI0002EBA417|nr:hypothetical protein [Ureaplasma urealyticum]
MSNIYLDELEGYSQKNIEDSIDSLIEPNQKPIHLCPFRILKGFIKITNTGEQSLLVNDKDFSTVWNIKASNEPIIAYWDKSFTYNFKGSLNYISKDYARIDPSNTTLKNNFKPYYFQAWVQNYSQANNVSTIVFNDKEHTVIKTITTVTLIVKYPSVYEDEIYQNEQGNLVSHKARFKQWTTDMLKEYLFIIPDEHAQANQWLMVNEVIPFYSTTSKRYEGAQITLTNVNDLLTSSGNDILATIQPCQPGDGYLWPVIQNGKLTYDERKEKPLGVKSIQLLTNGPYALNSMLITGRTYNNDTRELSANKRLLLYKAKIPVASKFFNVSAPTSNYVYLYNAFFEIEKIYKDQYEKQKDFTFDHNANIKLNGGLLLNHKWDASNNALSYEDNRYPFKLWDEGFKIHASFFNFKLGGTGAQKGGSLTENAEQKKPLADAVVTGQVAGEVVSTVFESIGRNVSQGFNLNNLGLWSFNMGFAKTKAEQIKEATKIGLNNITMPPGTNLHTFLNHNAFMYDLIKYLPYSYKETIRQNLGELIDNTPLSLGKVRRGIVDILYPGWTKVEDATGYNMSNIWLNTRGFNFIAPCLPLELEVSNKLKADLINLDIFTNKPAKTFSPLGIPAIACCYHFDITDRFAKFVDDELKVFDTELIGQTTYRDGTYIRKDKKPLYWDSFCEALPPNTPLSYEPAVINIASGKREDVNRVKYPYVIDTIDIKGLGKCDIKLTAFSGFYSPDARLKDEFKNVYEAIFESNGKYTDDMSQWSNYINFSTLDEINSVGTKLSYPKPPVETDFLKNTKTNSDDGVNASLQTINETLYKVGDNSLLSATQYRKPRFYFYEPDSSKLANLFGYGSYTNKLNYLFGGSNLSDVIVANKVIAYSFVFKWDFNYREWLNLGSVNKTKRNLKLTFEIESNWIQKGWTNQFNVDNSFQSANNFVGFELTKDNKLKYGGNYAVDLNTPNKKSTISTFSIKADVYDLLISKPNNSSIHINLGEVDDKLEFNLVAINQEFSVNSVVDNKENISVSVKPNENKYIILTKINENTFKIELKDYESTTKDIVYSIEPTNRVNYRLVSNYLPTYKIEKPFDLSDANKANIYIDDRGNEKEISKNNKPIDEFKGEDNERRLFKTTPFDLSDVIKELETNNCIKSKTIKLKTIELVE